MTVISIKHDTDLQLDTIVPTFDLTAFHRHYSMTQTDKKENKIFPPLHIFKNFLQTHIAHICFRPTAQFQPFAKAKECNLADLPKKIFNEKIFNKKK